MMKLLFKLASLLLALWALAAVCSAGIYDMVEGAKANPTSSTGIFWGVVQIILSFVVFWVVLWLGRAVIRFVSPDETNWWKVTHSQMTARQVESDYERSVLFSEPPVDDYQPEE